MTLDGALLDTAVFAYALGGEHELKRPCISIVAACGQNARVYASVEMVQELVHHRLRVSGNRTVSAQNGKDASALCTLLAFDREVLDVSLDLIERTRSVRGRDAVHAATALVYGIEHVVSPDTAFDHLPGLTRIDPREVTTA